MMEMLALAYFLAGFGIAASIVQRREGFQVEFVIITLSWPLVGLVRLYIAYLNHKGVDRPLNIRVLPKKKLAPNGR